MVAERDAVIPTRAPGTKTGAMEADSEASQVDCARGGVPSRTPSPNNKEENSIAFEATPAAGSDSSGQGSISVTKRDLNRVKGR